MKFTDWVENWKVQYKEEADCEVLKADISIVMKNYKGEIIIRKSEYRSKNLKEIKVVNNLPQKETICG